MTFDILLDRFEGRSKVPVFDVQLLSGRGSLVQDFATTVSRKLDNGLIRCQQHSDDRYYKVISMGLCSLLPLVST